MSKKWVYFFGGGKAEGNKDMKDILGGKGAGLAEMTNLGIPVPPGFTISTEACNAYFEAGKQYPEGLWDEVLKNMQNVEETMGRKFGDPSKPLLVSVRSGAKFSMPGMMETVLNLGLNDQTVAGLIEKSGDERFGYDAYRRFISMYGSICKNIDRSKFEDKIDEMKKRLSVKNDIDLDAQNMKELVSSFKDIYKQEVGEEFPSNPYEQLKGSINAVFGSWFGQKAATYRRLNGIPDDLGTAVNVCTMVFGNMGDTSGTGVAFTRNPSTGENKFYGEMLVNAQGEDVVAGIRTPINVDSMAGLFPEAHNDLMSVQNRLFEHYNDMLDLEFTIEDKKLWMLQTRVGKRTAAAALKIAIDLVHEGVIDKKTAVSRVEPEQLDQLLHPMIDPKAEVTKLAKGLPASPGAAVGKAVFTSEDAEEWKSKGEKIVLVRLETSPEDIGGMHAAEGIVTARGGMTSHAAVVARGMGTPCVAGCEKLEIDYNKKQFKVGDTIVKEGDFITLNGSTGDILLGEVPVIVPELSSDFAEFMGWVDEVKTLGVRTNADTPGDSQVARNFGAEGIGLCRTEHMFFEGERIKAVREMILAEDVEGRKKALAKILPMQKGDFKGIFKVMDGLPVTIRLLDPPLHEFLPQEEKQIDELSKEMGVSADKLPAKIAQLHEFNPMLGHRGCRLAITYPEICEMQTQAIIEAACELKKEGKNVIPEIMVPLVATVSELKPLKEIIVKTADDIINKAGVDLKYTVGTMIELPRAAITADEIAKEAEFFSFGTNDLTQTTFGLSRDDAGRFLPYYVDKKILPEDPFVSIDQNGVGELMKVGIEKGKKTRANIKLGICGEHGGDPASVKFCHSIGLNYVSCSPYRVPVAKLAAAHAAISAGESTTA